MMEVSRKMYKAPWKTFTIYTVQEANERGIAHKYWRDAREGDEGTWILSDDGWVGECISVKSYKRSYVDKAHPEPYDRFVRSSVGRGIDNRWGKMVFAVPGQIGTKRQLKKRKIIARTFAECLMRGKKVDFAALGLIWRPTAPPEFRVRNAKKLIYSESMQTMIKEEVVKALADSRWSVSTVLDRYNDVYNRAAKSDQRLAKDVLDKMADILDMEPERQQVRMNANFNMGNTGEFLLPAGADEMDQLNAKAEVKQIEQ